METLQAPRCNRRVATSGLAWRSVAALEEARQGSWSMASSTSSRATTTRRSSWHPDYNKDHVERVKYLESKLEELQPKMLEIVQFLLEKDRTFDEFKAAAGVEEDLEAFEMLHLGFSMSKKGRGKNAKDVVKPDEHYEAWAAKPEGPATLPGRIVEPTIDLSWDAFQLQARLTHALPYVYYQGKTVANKTLWLMNVRSPHFSMRHLIMGLGRVQESQRVKILDPSREAALVIPSAKEVFYKYEEWAQAQRKEEMETRALLEAAQNAVNAEVELEEDFSEEEEEGVYVDPFADVGFDD
jgi:hypothetical protein